MNRPATDTPASTTVAPLTGIVMGAEPACCIRIRTWLQARQRGLQLHIVTELGRLDHALCLRSTDFVIIVVADGNSQLPGTLRRVQHVHTLVLVESADIGALPDWLFKGVDAVCRLHDTAALHTSLDTLVDVCTLRRRLTLLRAPESRQSAMLRALLSTKAANPSVLANGSRLALRAWLAGTTHPLIDPSGAIDIPALRSWQSLAEHDKAACTAREGAEEHTRDEPGFEARQPTDHQLGVKRAEVAARRSMKQLTRKRAGRVAWLNDTWQ